jgi:hypothetical protein
MKPLINHESKRDLLRRIAADYRTQGCEVKVQPGPGDLPDFLTDFQPDLIVSGKGETIVIDVKTRGELKDIQTVEGLQSILQNRPGWRFELIIDGTGTEPRETLSSSQIRAMLEEGIELQQRAHSAAALLLLWSATEGALRLLASRENVELESLAPGYVITLLYTLGLLGREQYQTLDGAMRLRHQAAHGFHVLITPEDLTGISQVLRELLGEVGVKAA